MKKQTNEFLSTSMKMKVFIDGGLPTMRSEVGTSGKTSRRDGGLLKSYETYQPNKYIKFPKMKTKGNNQTTNNFLDLNLMKNAKSKHILKQKFNSLRGSNHNKQQNLTKRSDLRIKSRDRLDKSLSQLDTRRTKKKLKRATTPRRARKAILYEALTKISRKALEKKSGAFLNRQLHRIFKNFRYLKCDQSSSLTAMKTVLSVFKKGLFFAREDNPKTIEIIEKIGNPDIAAICTFLPKEKTNVKNPEEEEYLGLTYQECLSKVLEVTLKMNEYSQLQIENLNKINKRKSDQISDLQSRRLDKDKKIDKLMLDLEQEKTKFTNLTRTLRSTTDLNGLISEGNIRKAYKTMIERLENTNQKLENYEIINKNSDTKLEGYQKKLEEKKYELRKLKGALLDESEALADGLFSFTTEIQRTMSWFSKLEESFCQREIVMKPVYTRIIPSSLTKKLLIIQNDGMNSVITKLIKLLKDSNHPMLKTTLNNTGRRISALNRSLSPMGTIKSRHVKRASSMLRRSYLAPRQSFLKAIPLSHKQKAIQMRYANHREGSKSSSNVSPFNSPPQLYGVIMEEEEQGFGSNPSPVKSIMKVATKRRESSFNQETFNSLHSRKINPFKIPKKRRESGIYLPQHAEIRKSVMAQEENQIDHQTLKVLKNLDLEENLSPLLFTKTRKDLASLALQGASFGERINDFIDSYLKISDI